MHLAAPLCAQYKIVHAASCHRPLHFNSTTCARLHAPNITHHIGLSRRCTQVRAGPTLEEEPFDEDDWEEEDEDLEVEDFEDVTITTNEKEAK